MTEPIYHSGNQQDESPRSPQPPISHHYEEDEPTRKSTHEKKKSSSPNGRMFLYGFLGALVACVICLAGYSLIFGGKGPLASTYIGSQDSSVINAVEEGYTVPEAVATKVLPSVVSIYNYQEASTTGIWSMQNQSQSGTLTPVGMGSGVVISDDGYIITNYHVVESAKKVTVMVNGVERDAHYVGGDKSSDIAVVKVEDTSDLVAADIGDSDTLRIGEWVMTVGAPLGLEGSVATGVVSATNRSTYMNNDQNAYTSYSKSAPEYTYYPNMIQTDAVINPGNSGGALVDADGKLIGINSVISSYSGDYAGVGFAIPINYAIGIATDIIEGKTPTHAMLGVSITTVNAQNAQRYGLSVTSGAYINAITPGTAAENSALKPGDIITAIDGQTVTSATDVTLKVRSHKVGDTVVVTVNRDGQEQKIDVILSSDELIDTSATTEQDQSNPNDSGNGNGMSQRELEQLLRLFGF